QGRALLRKPRKTRHKMNSVNCVNSVRGGASRSAVTGRPARRGDRHLPPAPAYRFVTVGRKKSRFGTMAPTHWRSAVQNRISVNSVGACHLLRNHGKCVKN